MKALVLFSGGVDSTTCLALAIHTYGKENVICLSISYGQKHVKELEATKKIASYYGVSILSLDLASLFSLSDCSLLSHSDKAIPQKSYHEQLKESENKPVSTYVPFRNGLFLSSAATIALSTDCDCIYFGAHLDDAAGNAYPDCSQDFYTSMEKSIYEGSGKKLKLIAPFINLNKSQIVARGLELSVPYQLTWSCYEGDKVPCGKCGTCIDRQKAFETNNIEDPLSIILT
ncbi:7-cyano-7-deazaguanine synthase QueC [Anaeromicropila herbilytica]|uniref:7-cyano-7-deazaguanine synthase n=1 Tax=Anaeromicropila herbilytica TaxID=2785025 RepID=A0A7R7EP51_9FIRM|nr:7-cyano-7-deazaguanine synthase QueC [Anaeromicropila herbilytica]BCN32475.1 7-cyano-7-deazaguanine synthase [Anaeromicropila herbilytica]